MTDETTKDNVLETLAENGMDPWRGWEPVWSNSKKKVTTHDWQEEHHPTELDRVEIEGEERPRLRVRRIVDARLWGAMSGIQQAAALEISYAFAILCRGVGMRSSNPERLPGSHGYVEESDRQMRLITRYFKWGKECEKEHLNHAATVDILGHGYSCREVDKARRVRTGTARQNLFACIDLYAELRGWS